MLRPLRDRVLVRLDESLPNAAGIYLKPDVSRWRARNGAVEGWNRGTVVGVGPGRKNASTGDLMPLTVRLGDVVRFSELEFPEHKEGGHTYALIQEADVLMVENG